MPARYYRLSGRFEAVQAGVAAVGGAAAAALLAVAYAYAVLYIPLGGYVSFLLAAGFGLGIGFGQALFLRLMKVRNVVVVNLIVAGAAVFGLYVSWAVWTYALMARSGLEQARLLPILANPSLLARLVASVNETGAWSIKNFTPTGFALTLLWLAEAAIVFVAAGLSGVRWVSAAVFCEQCGEWCQEDDGVASLAAQTPSYVRRRLEAGDLAFLARLGAAPSGAAAFFRLDLHSCTRCEATHTLTVSQVQVTTGRDGKQRQETSAVVDKLLIGPAEDRWLRALGQGRNPMPPLDGSSLDAPTTGVVRAPDLPRAPAAPSPPPVPAGRVPSDPKITAARRRIEISSVRRAPQASSQRTAGTLRLGYRTTAARGPVDAGGALRAAAFRGVISEAGLWASDHGGSARQLAWTEFLEIVVMQLPSDPPWDSAIVVDLVPAEGPAPIRLVTGSFIDWRALPGGGTAAPVERVRALCRFALDRNPQIAIEDGTRRFCLEGGPCPRVLSMRHFAEYDARYA